MRLRKDSILPSSVDLNLQHAAPNKKKQTSANASAFPKSFQILISKEKKQ